MLIALCPSSEYKFSYLLLKGEKSAIAQFTSMAWERNAARETGAKRVHLGGRGSTRAVTVK
jgi:hypothetical protein